MNRARVTPEWAIGGKPPGGSSDYHILACGPGELSRDDFDKIRIKFTIGTPEELPQLAIGWAGGRKDARVVMAFHERSEETDWQGRGIVRTRYFCVPYTQIGRPPVGYEELYRSLLACRLPPAEPLEASVAFLDSQRIAEQVTGTAVSAAALLLTGRHVCVTHAHDVPLLERVRFLDTVAALLPYGMRTKMTASTWTSSAAVHQIRLSFAEHAPAGTYAIRWGAEAEPSWEKRDAVRYHQLLREHVHNPAMIRWLAGCTVPLSFNDQGRLRALTMLECFDAKIGPPSRGLVAFDPPAEYTFSPLTDGLGDLLIWCATMLPHGTPHLARAISALDSAAKRQEHSISQEQRHHYRHLIQERHMLAPHAELDPEMQAAFYTAVLTVGYGARLTIDRVEAILRDVGTPADPLVKAMIGMSADVPTKLTLAAIVGGPYPSQTLEKIASDRLVEAVVSAPGGADVFRMVVAELARRGHHGEDESIAGLLQKHCYLLEPGNAAYRSENDRFTALTNLVGAVHPSGLPPEMGTHPGPPGLAAAPLLAAAVNLYGENAARTLMHSAIRGYLREAKLDAVAVKEIERRLDETKRKAPAAGTHRSTPANHRAGGRRRASSRREASRHSPWEEPLFPPVSLLLGFFLAGGAVGVVLAVLLGG